MHARTTGKGWKYETLPPEFLTRGKPKLSTTPTGVAVLAPYLLELVQRMITIDIAGARYEGGDEERVDVGAYKKRQLPFSDLELTSSRRKRHQAHDERDKIVPVDDPQLLAYEGEFVDEVIMTNDMRKVRNRQTFHKIVAVEVQPKGDAFLWMVVVVECNESGVIPETSMSADGQHVLSGKRDALYLRDETNPNCPEMEVIRGDIQAYAKYIRRKREAADGSEGGGTGPPPARRRRTGS